MDWFSTMIWHLTMLTVIKDVYSVRINPFSGLPESPYDPVADYSNSQGSYFRNMPMASIFPLMNDESINTMIGIPALKSQMTPFMNPLLSSVQQGPIARPSSNRNKVKNNQNNNQKNLNRNSQQNQQRGRGVTLDIRGGGYKVDQQQSPKPYKAPIAESSGRDSQRYNNGRKPGENPRKPSGNNPPRTRKQNQRPRGPNMKNPHYNMKFESSLPSMPPNVEFVNPENVLPFHPRIYKQFLQNNKQFGAYMQNLSKQNAFKSPSPNGGNFGQSFKKNTNNQGNTNNQAGTKVTRNRGNPLNSPIAQPSQLSNFPNNFQMPGTPDLSSQFGFLQQQNGGKSPNSPLDSNFFSQDPSFYVSLSQTPEGLAYLGQLFQQHQMKSQNKPRTNSPRGPFANKPPQQNLNPSFSNSGLPSFQSGMKLPQESGIPSPYTPNFYASNHGPLDGSHNLPNQQAPSPEGEYQQMMMNFQQQMQQLSPNKQFPLPNGPAAFPTYREQATPSPSYPSNPQQYDGTQTKINPYSDYPFVQGSSYQDSQPQIPVGAQQSYDKNINTPYDVTNYASSYQASQNHQVKSQPSNVQTADQAGYTLPPYSPVDPLASPENGNPGAQDYYTYQHTTSHHKSPLYSNDQSSPSYTNGGSSGMYEISPYPDDKKNEPYSIIAHKNEAKSPSTDIEAGYMTPEQLLGPQSTGLQSDAKFGFPSGRGTLLQSSSSPTLNSESTESEVPRLFLGEQPEGSDRAALHLPEEVSIYVARQTDNPFLYEFTESYDPFSYELEDKAKDEGSSSEQTDSKDSSATESESDEKLHESIKEFQKLLTKAPKSSYMVEPTEATPSTKRLKATTTRAPVPQKTLDSDETKNHKNTHSYMFQYAPTDKSTPKPSPTWHAWRPNVSKYHLPLPDAKPQVTTTTTPSPTTITTTVPTTTTTELPSTAAGPYPTMSYYHEPETPICARYNNLTYCLQDPEYPKDLIKEAIEKNRHPLDHFLVDISASSNIVDDNLDKVFENSVPLQSTSVSYSFEGKAIAPAQGEQVNSTGCSSNVYYAKPLRAINTAGLWKIIVNVEFEETGANYTQTVRIEECSQTSGYVATCGTETISACLQQYKLYRLLAWESHRGFYIDAFLLPISCFCGSQQSR